ncbi:hypothetical protein SAMN06272771_3576 [Streptomyces sp. Ag82_O1-12]|uniref:hypothetical protein n=1 Tax=unclassified Streptomyces TaxID=2593676 RepID=UPI000BCB59DF|nr:MULTISPECIES: hypothetical protein [unclassified Streptomyces]SMQ17191.1 hypothetical protein SAMN06272771_3576 [Streptomyces sp. Ag82_O1-12]SOD46220.1 hypothetical protein SAMN06272727_3573 [Streptomyces sp. Ag82_G6-1]
MTKYVKLLTRGTGVGAAAFLLAVAIPGSAQAAADPVYAGCNTTGASGLLRDTQLTESPGGTHAVHFEISDTAADRHHARVRYLTKMGNGKTKSWKWNPNYEGVGTIVVNTSAKDQDNGIFRVGIEVARAEGSSILNSCIAWEP